MRIIGGELKGRTLPPPPGDATRPTTDVLKESLFAALEHLVTIKGAHIIDLCAGSGGLAFEALSRGARSALLVDTSTDVCRHLRSVAITLGLTDRVTIVRADAVSVARTFDLGGATVVFADPPYGAHIGNSVLSALVANPHLAPEATIVIEHGDRESLVLPDNGTSIWHKERGETVIDVVRYERPTP